MHYILIIDDDPEQLQAHQFFLKTHGCSVSTISSGSEALKLLEDHSYDLILLDVKMPDSDGFQLCGRIKEITKSPVIFLSNYAQDEDQVLGFYAGGYDYISKDSSLELFRARVSSCLASKESMNNILRFPPLTIDLKRQHAFIDNNDLLLTQTEFMLLTQLASSPNKIWTVSALYREIWGEYGEANPVLVQMHISRMRSKLEKAFPRHDFIETVWGKGYQFVPIDDIVE